MIASGLGMPLIKVKWLTGQGRAARPPANYADLVMAARTLEEKQTGRAGVVSRLSPNQTIGASAHEVPVAHNGKCVIAEC